jgi:hypothetical protein
VTGPKKTPGLLLLDARTMYATMVRALTALHRARPSSEYVAIACLISCYIDAIAAGGGRASRAKFERFVRRNFKQMCEGLSRELRVADGATVFYKPFRNGMVHTFFTRDGRFALAEDHELHGKYVGRLAASGHIGLNIDRLYRDFLALARSRAKRTSRSTLG